MSKVDDEVSIARITIPGTHDSGALLEPLPGTARTQSANISEQLEFGVRLLDVRCRHIDDGFQIHHGMVNQNQSFDDVLKCLVDFLDANPSEVVVMSVNQEFTPKNNTRSFQATFDAYVAKDRASWYLRSEVPKLGGVRGRMVLLRRFARSSPMGIDASRWPGNRSFSRKGLRVQDEYQVKEVGLKWAAVLAGLEAAMESKGSGFIYLNFTSGVKSGRLGLPDITDVSRAINPKLIRYFKGADPGFYGWLMMDFATPELVELVYSSNFPDGGGSSLDPMGR
ncbi:phosphatidylinositol-specific phospholipase C [Haloferula sp.]|uniref:phosphatidylinositol-specific phospholipase C n=1 Tax=Haloferula sp. TaxID=2497595 RepID=UPI00329E8E45